LYYIYNPVKVLINLYMCVDKHINCMYDKLIEILINELKLQIYIFYTNKNIIKQNNKKN